MSNIEYSDINENFPIQGQDNPSQGFRTNFGLIKGALQQTRVEVQALQSTVQGVIDSTGMWIGDPTGLQGPQGTQGVQGEVGPTGINYNNTVIINLGDFSAIDSIISISPVNTGSRIYLARLTGADMNGTINITALSAEEYGECILLLSSTTDGTNSMSVSNVGTKWINGSNFPLSPLLTETIGLYVQSIAGILYLSHSIWF